ncbi:hypothetical protein F4777DRAFT_572029, partial [Nemania sp. FL0916]
MDLLNFLGFSSRSSRRPATEHSRRPATERTRRPARVRLLAPEETGLLAPERPERSAPEPSRRPVAENGTLYFAYGSDLHLTQMAERCPDSVFKGKAVLPGYRWQINECGLANVVRSRSHSVEGLLFLINSQDERSLDRSGSVARGFYQKHFLTVTLEPDRRYEDSKCSDVAHSLLESRERSGLTSQGPNSAGVRSVRALVYVSEIYTTDGTIREEYISRMRKAISDAEILGVSRSFIDRYISPVLDRRNETRRHERGGPRTNRPIFIS